MRLKAIHIWFLVVLALFSFLGKLSAQDTLEISNYKIRFQKNLEELDDLYCWSDTAFSQGKIVTNSVVNFPEEVEKLHLQIFGSPVVLAEDFFGFLNGLSVKQKEQLIRFFCADEKYFSETLKSAGLPGELKYMAPAFSAMNRDALGEEGRAGVWQLTYFQGILNGLNINRLVDERLNERLAIQAYTREIRQDEEIFGSPELAVLAQWYGKAKVKNAIYFAGGNSSLAKILEQLPGTVYEKIAAFQAVAVFLNVNHVKEKTELTRRKTVPDTVNVVRQLHFRQVSEVLNIPEKQLVFLNPQYRFEIVPANVKQFRMALPAGFRDDYAIWHDSIFHALDSTLFEVTTQKIEYPPAPNRQYLGEPVKDLVIEGKTKIKYRLKTGDVLGIIAEKYDVRVADLKYWNNIINERRIQAGKNLDIFVDDDKVEYYQNMEENEEEESKPSANMVEKLQQGASLKALEDLEKLPKVEYEVKSGESPYTIAKQFDGVTPEDILRWNKIDDARKIQVGQKLIIYIKE